MKRLCLFVPCMLVTLGCLTGCPGATEKGGTATGSVSYKEKPVTGASMTLHYPDKTTRSISVAPDGTFNATGVLPGSVKVTITTEFIKKMRGNTPNIKPPKDSKPPPTTGESGAALVYVPIPSKYADAGKTPLTWEIKDGAQKKDFILTD